MHVKDITLDEILLNYLSHGELPKDKAKTERILRSSKFIYMDD